MSKGLKIKLYLRAKFRKLERLKCLLHWEFYEDCIISTLKFFIRRNPISPFYAFWKTLFVAKQWKSFKKYFTKFNKHFSSHHPFVSAFGSFVFLILVIGGIFYFVFNRNTQEAKATWWNDSWQHRQSIQVTNNVSQETNVYLSVTLDTDTASTSMQADCGDFRFTKENGEVLPYYIVSGCQTTSNVIHINFQTFEAGEQAIYFYYGNPSAENGFESSDFDTEASDYTIGAVGTAEVGPGPVGYWSFDEGYGATAHDESGQGNDGTISGAVWSNEENCVSGKCLYFDGYDDEVNISNTINEIKTVSFWAKSTGSADTYIRLNGMSYHIDMSYNVISIVGFTSPTIYINGTEGNQTVLNEWNMITMTTNIAITASSITIGNISMDAHNGFIDEVKIYPYARTADQIKQDYNAGLSGVKSKSGVAVSFGGASDKWMSDGLVGYWKMDSAAGAWDGTADEVIDASGNGNHGVASGDASTTGGKFGNGGVFKGEESGNDYIEFDYSPNYELPDSGGSVAFWVKFDSTVVLGQTRKMGILRKAINSNWDALGGYEITLFQSGPDDSHYLRMQTGGTNDVDDLFSTTQIQNEQWYHVVLSWDLEKIYIYLDGQLDASEDKTKTITWSGSEPLRFSHLRGLYGAANYRLGGKLDEVRIYNRALSKSEVRKLYEWAPGPVMHLKMDEKSGGTAYDTSGNENDGTLTNGSSWVNGKYGSALNFDGDEDYLAMGDVSVLDGVTNFSIGAWVNPSVLSGVRDMIVSKDTEYEFFFNDGDICLRVNNLSYDGIEYPFAVDTWYYISVTQNDGGKNYYVNGEYIGTAGSPTMITGGIVSLNLGGRVGGHYLEGSIDDVKIYNYARTQKQILEDMNGGGPASKMPVLHLSFDEGRGATAYDKSIHSNDGTLTSGAGGTNTTVSSMWDKNGKNGGAMEFDGTDDWVDVLSSNVFATSTKPFSFTSWIYLDSFANTYSKVAILRTDTTTPFEISFSDNASYLGIVIGSQSNWAQSKTDTPAADLTGAWKHIGVTYNGLGSGTRSNFNVYIDSIKQTFTAPGGFAGLSQMTRIGATGGASNFWDGRIDEVKIWNYALTEDEVKQEYNGGSAMSLGGGTASANNDGTTVTGANAKYCVPGDTAQCDAPVLELAMDEMTGTTVYDTSGNGNNGTISGASWDPIGKHGSALDFDGVNDIVNIPTTNDVFDFGSYDTAKFTVSTWVKTDTSSCTLGDGSDVYVSRYSGSTIFLIRCRTDNKASFYVRDSNNNSADTGDGITSLNDNEWHFLTGVYDNSEVRIYVDGVLENSNTDTLTGNFDSASDIYIAQHGGNYEAAGIVDGVRIYDYARTPAQIAYDYNKGKPIAHWKMNEGVGTTVYDWSGNENEGTMTNMDASTDWVTGKVGKALDFDGSDDYIDIGDTGIDINSVSFWLKQDYTDANIIDLDGGTHTVTISDSNATATGFSSPTIYIDGENKTTLPDNAWHHVLITTATAIDANDFDIGRIASDYFIGQIDEVKLYNYSLTSTQAKTDFSGGAVGFGYSGITSGSALTSSWTCGTSNLVDIDSNTYATVQIGTQCWMAENLMVTRNADGSAVDGTGDADTTPPAAYGDANGGHDGADADWEEVEGYTYNWQDAMNGSAVAGAQGICPDDWHLPTHDEWTDLERYICETEVNGSCDTTFPKDTSTTGYRGTNEGTELKNATNVNGQAGDPAGDPGGDDGYNFSALLAGTRFISGAFRNRGTIGIFWSSSESGSYAWYRFVYSSNAGVNRNDVAKANGFFVRCVQD